MEPTDLTLHVLIEIRDEIRGTNARVDRLEARVDRLESAMTLSGEQVHGALGQLARRVTEAELRTATVISELAGSVRDLHTLLRDRLDLRDRVDRCERDIDDLKRRVN
jgi:predicted  nucleic acid-binding Zn-ribbon protein